MRLQHTSEFTSLQNRKEITQFIESFALEIKSNCIKSTEPSVSSTESIPSSAVQEMQPVSISEERNGMNK